MAIEVDKTIATKLLNHSYVECSKKPVKSCCIKSTIDFVMTGKSCLTYRYIMFTALLAKAVNPSIDILSLQAGDNSKGAYDARSLASKVIYEFQYSLLGNVLDGSNNDPLVNKPGRFLRLSPNNAAANGDPKKALYMLCHDLPMIDRSDLARQCVDYIVSLLLQEKAMRDSKKSDYDNIAKNMDIFNVRQFMSDLLDQGFGGVSLVLVSTALYSILFHSDDYRIIAHPANQASTSKKQFSDLDIYYNEKPFMGTELKDKPFSSTDVEHAAETAFSAGASSLMFIAGRQSTFASQPPTYFATTREKYANKGMYVGVASIDNLLDIILTAQMNTNILHLLDVIRDTAEEIGALEALMWIYKRISEIK